MASLHAIKHIHGMNEEVFATATNSQCSLKTTALCEATSPLITEVHEWLIFFMLEHE